MTSSLLGIITTLLDLPGGNVGGMDGCMMAVLLMTLWGTRNIENLACTWVAETN